MYPARRFLRFFLISFLPAGLRTYGEKLKAKLRQCREYIKTKREQSSCESCSRSSLRCDLGRLRVVKTAFNLYRRTRLLLSCVLFLWNRHRSFENGGVASTSLLFFHPLRKASFRLQSSLIIGLVVLCRPTFFGLNFSLRIRKFPALTFERFPFRYRPR